MKVDIHKADARGNVLTTLTATQITFREKTFFIPRGFESDGASVPRIFWSTVCPPLDPRTVRAGVAHDWIYRTQPEGWTRAEADLMFLCYLIEDGLSVYHALKAYIGVRIGGWAAWSSNATLIAVEKEGR